MINPEIDEYGWQDLVREVDTMFEFFSRLAGAAPNVQVRQIRHGCVHLQITRGDELAVATQYLYSERSRHSPLLRAERSSPLYQTFANEFEALWRANAPGMGAPVPGETAAAS
jgi:hypothetical protein